MNRLTVIIPMFQAAEGLPRTLSSLPAAVDDSVDLLFIDDASTDGGAELVEQAKLPRARVVRRDRNLGVASARNLGLRLAETEYLTFLDADDTVQSGYFPALRSAIADLGVQFVRTDHSQQFGERREVHRVPGVLPRSSRLNPREAILPVAESTPVDYPYSWAGAYHRELAAADVLTFPLLHVAEDRPWIWQLHLQAESFALAELNGIVYHREIGTSLTAAKDSRQLDFVTAMERVIDLVRADAETERFLPKALRRYCSLTLHHLASLHRFRPEVARTFTLLLARSLGALPAQELASTLAGFTPAQRLRLRLLLSGGTTLPSFGSFRRN